MQKKMIVLTVASLISGAAFAQSNLTIYGTADAGWYYAKGDKLSRTGIDSGEVEGSHIGFKGEEALGNSLKAIFTMEYGTDIDGGDNNGALASTRQAFVGLSSNAGILTLGRQYAPSYLSMARNSANEITMNQPINAVLDDVIGGFAGGTMTVGDDARWNNSIAYQSPNWSGFETRVVYGFGENAKDSSNADSPGTMDDGRFGISGSYTNGPFNVDLIYQTRRSISSTVGTKSGDDVNEWYLGGAYDFQMAKVFASYQQSKYDADVSNSDKSAKLWSLGVAVPVSDAGTLSFEYAESRYDTDDGVTDGRTRGFGGAYMHNLSKRTMLYAGLGYGTNKDRNGAGSSLDLGYKGVGEAGESNWSMTTGIKHSF